MPTGTTQSPADVCFVADFAGEILELAHEPWDDCDRRCLSRTAAKCERHSPVYCCARCGKQLRKVPR